MKLVWLLFEVKSQRQQLIGSGAFWLQDLERFGAVSWV